MKLFIILSFFILANFSLESNPQPSEERKAQEALPKSSHPLWKMLQQLKINYDKKSGIYSATYNDAIKSMVGKEIEITGFMLPLEPAEKFKHFLLSKRTPTCFFCPPGTPNEVIDVWMEKPIKWYEEPIKIKGRFALTNQQNLGLFFKIESARLVK